MKDEEMPEFLAPPPILDAMPGHPTSQEQWHAGFKYVAYSAEELESLELPSRESILGTWFKQGDLGFIYGPRGLGKTWLAMYLARQIADGGKVAMWAANGARRVLYVDGEMPRDGLIQRHKSLAPKPSPNMRYIQHEALFHKCGGVINLADQNLQKALTASCVDLETEVLVLDNLSCLFSGIKENDADGWDRVLPWLLDLRRKHIAVVFVAHAGRNGFMRGTSRREDAAFWILQLSQSHGEEDQAADGARFTCRFDKNRNATEQECPPIEWTFRRGTGSAAEILWKPVNSLDKLRIWVEAGITSPSEIAFEMKVTLGRVCQLAKQAIKQGWLRKEGRNYDLVPDWRPPGTLSAQDAAEVLSGMRN